MNWVLHRSMVPGSPGSCFFRIYLSCSLHDDSILKSAICIILPSPPTLTYCISNYHAVIGVLKRRGISRLSMSGPISSEYHRSRLENSDEVMKQAIDCSLGLCPPGLYTMRITWRQSLAEPIRQVRSPGDLISGSVPLTASPPATVHFYIYTLPLFLYLSMAHH